MTKGVRSFCQGQPSLPIQSIDPGLNQLSIAAWVRLKFAEDTLWKGSVEIIRYLYLPLEYAKMNFRSALLHTRKARQRFSLLSDDDVFSRYDRLKQAGQICAGFLNVKRLRIHKCLRGSHNLVFIGILCQNATHVKAARAVCCHTCLCNLHMPTHGTAVLQSPLL